MEQVAVNAAATDRAAFIVTTQEVAVPEHAPDHPLKDEPLAGAAESVTELPLAKLAEQFAPQEIPAGEELTVPLPLPVFEAVSVNEDPVGVQVG